MLKFISFLLLIVSIIVRFIILKGIITYKKEGKENNKYILFILLVLIYIIYRISEYEPDSYNTNYLVNSIVCTIWGVYYNYFYEIGYFRYIIIYYLFNIYYDLLHDIVYRFLFFIMTGNVLSSKESLSASYLESMRISIYTSLFILLVYVLIYLIFNFFNNHLKLINHEKRNYVYLLFALIANTSNIIIYYISYKLERFSWLRSERYYFENFVAPKLIGASSIFLVLIFIQIIRENKLKSQNELIKNKLDMQYTHYLSIQESHMKVKKLYHDINNHICCIDKLKNNTKEINEYVNNLKDEIKEFKSIYNTGNMILDIIINEKSELCSKKGIKFICDINFSKINFIKPIDISSIFANILDNAIEACDKIYNEDINKYIIIKGTITKSFYVIKCENSKINNIIFNKNILLTDKMDKFIHGIGIKSIKSSLQKYNGEILFEDEKEKFILNIYIPFNQNIDSWATYIDTEK